MEKKEFLEKLARSLAGQVPQGIIEENLRYYDSYLADEIAKGRTIHEILEELGDPRLIAKSIIEANGGGNSMAGIYEDSSQSSGYRQEEEGTESSYFRSFHFSSFWAVLILVAILLIIFLVIGTIIGGIFLVLRPILLPLMLVWIVYWIFRGRKNRW